MKKLLSTCLLFVLPFMVKSQYYADALGKNGTALKTSLHNIIKNHQDKGWPLWPYFYSTDARNGNEVWDIYSDIPNATPPYIFVLGTNQCGTYSQEGICYNHEHTWPSTYFNDAQPMRTDLHHVFPTDGFVNNKRSNFPFGKTNNTVQGTPTANGSKLGVTTSYTIFSSSNTNKYAFEPIDEYKGDMARVYFYMSTRYEGEDAGWENWEMANGATLTSAAINLLLQWHAADPVSQKEINRNEAIYLLQGNRNPFIDYPQFVACIWAGANCQSLSVENLVQVSKLKLYPNPSHDFIMLESKTHERMQNIRILDMTGRCAKSVTVLPNEPLDISTLSNGMYFVETILHGEKFVQTFLKN